MTSRQADGFTLVELLIVCVLIGILAALVAPFLMAAKAASNEASAIGSLRALNSAQTTYATSCGGSNYASTFTILVTGKFASADMDLSPKSGYAFQLTPGAGAASSPDCGGNPTQTAYYASATPLSSGNGRRGFATNVASVIWQDTSGTPPAEPFAVTSSIGPIQ